MSNKQTPVSLAFSQFKAMPLVPGNGVDVEPYFYVTAQCPKFNDSLIVANFTWDWSCMEAEHYQQQAQLMAEAFADKMNELSAPKKPEVTVKFQVSDELFKEIYETGGIGYWCAESRTTAEGVLELRARGDKAWHAITPLKFSEAIQEILKQKPHQNSSRNSIQAMIVENDACHIDVECSDWIIQLACFGELVYS